MYEQQQGRTTRTFLKWSGVNVYMVSFAKSKESAKKEPIDSRWLMCMLGLHLNAVFCGAGNFLQLCLRKLWWILNFTLFLQKIHYINKRNVITTPAVHYVSCNGVVRWSSLVYVDILHQKWIQFLELSILLQYLMQTSSTESSFREC